MGARIFFLVIALALVAAGMWAYRHDEALRKNSAQVNLGDPNEMVRELLGNPTSEGPCGSLTAGAHGLLRRIRLPVLVLGLSAAV